jgi:hypothetical protein
MDGTVSNPPSAHAEAKAGRPDKQPAKDTKKPDIVLMLVDNFGWGELAVWLILYRDTKRDGTPPELRLTTSLAGAGWIARPHPERSASSLVGRCSRCFGGGA